MKRLTPAVLAAAASRTEPSWFIAYVIVGASWPTGSFDSSAMWTTASKPSRSLGASSRMSRAIVFTGGRRVVVERSRPIEAGVEPHDVEPSFNEVRAQHGADVPVASGYEQSHAR